MNRYEEKQDQLWPFRAGIITKLTVFYNIVSNIDCSSRALINDAVKSFTDNLRSGTDSLFS